MPASASPSRPGAEASILIVEDDVALLRALAASVAAEGYRVETASSGESALQAANDFGPDLIVLDLGLPDLDGVDVCRRLRRWTAAPVIILTADGEVQRKVLALDEGADDYLTKPFALPELLARIRVALRHLRAAAGTVHDAHVVVGDLAIDVAAREATAGGERMELARKEFDILVLLARNESKLVTYKRILAVVWGADGNGSTQALRTQVALIRRKLGAGPARPRIENESGLGYRLVSADMG